MFKISTMWECTYGMEAPQAGLNVTPDWEVPVFATCIHLEKSELKTSFTKLSDMHGHGQLRFLVKRNF